jgi:hypothetical protein
MVELVDRFVLHVTNQFDLWSKKAGENTLLARFAKGKGKGKRGRVCGRMHS